MPKHIKRIECCYCGASSLINLNNPHEMRLVCSGCSAKMSVDKLTPLTPAAAPAPIPRPEKPTREIRFDRPDDDEHDYRERGKRRDDDRRPGKGRRRKRRTFLNRLEDIWDEIEDIFD